jgi:hypothetical protein
MGPIGGNLNRFFRLTSLGLFALGFILGAVCC